MPSEPSRDPVVVTGGAGAIGSVLVASLSAGGSQVRVIDNLSSGRRDSIAPLIDQKRVTLHVADLRTQGAIDSEFRGAASAWHLAANPDIRRGTADPNLDFDHGTLASFRFLEAARKADVRTLFFSSSSVVYGYPKTFPTPEEYGPLLPESLYGASKLASEGLFSAYAHSYGIRVNLFRFANIIGPGMTHGVIFDFFEKLRRDPSRLEVLGDGRQSKSYLRTEECVDAMRFVGDHASEPVNLFNLGTHDRIAVQEIAEVIVSACGGKGRIEYTGGDRGWTGDIPQQLLSIERLGRLGWKPKHTSRQAVEQTVREMARARGF
ncbi:MAG: NAD-dependent epimerase/dehydratase family protein [Thermoplasmata archaeon]|nr:NAD-dependent epimerase/dehydratase family protein [Thermoplasmata archaeon]MCI4359100.1 NAD-dependent epimerase/dehydratase family protein [Thermoplasmata archaeon]